MTLRWGIAATGGIASKMAAALQTLDDAEIVAVGSRSPESANKFAKTFAIPQAHGSYDELFADPNVDIVYIASPHSHHRDMAVAALDAGKHVLCEKAFAINTTEATEMVDAARRNNRFLMEAMWTWFIPGNVELKRRIADGAIGKVLTVDADFALDIPATDGRHRRADLAGGASFPGGALSTFQTSLDGTSGLSARIVGTAGRIDVESPFWFTSAFTVSGADGAVERIEIPNKGLAHEAAHAMERIAAGHLESDVVTLDHSLQTMRLLDEIRAQVGVVYPSEG